MSPLTPLIGFVALILDRVVGYPSLLQSLIGHPVQWIGALIDLMDRLLNKPSEPEPVRRLLGGVTVIVAVAVALIVTVPVTVLLRDWTYGWVVEALLATPLLAQKSLRQHVEAVADGLDRGLLEGRKAVSRIVGRDPAGLDRAGVSRAAIESLAENASDGVVAPAFWLLLFGLPGIAAYKAINTADSMIGHLSDRHRAFGWAAARLDDLVNLPASRLCGLFFALAAWPKWWLPLRSMWRHASLHVSPNAGWPEAAVAGALAIRLGGPRNYGGHTVDLAWIGDGRENLAARDIRRALKLYRRMLTVVGVIFEFLAILGLLYLWW